MNRLKNLVKTHIPETVCIAVMVVVFTSMLLYAVYLHHKVESSSTNPFAELQNPAYVINVPEESEMSSDLRSDVYYRAEDGNKYHLPTCSYVKKSDNVSAVTPQMIKEKGYEPCKICL